MKIKALRVREVGRFGEPVAVEGFSGGLDVLAGPNEMGKSTLFRALRALLTAKHTSKSEAVTGLQPYAGGQPLVEADVEIDGGAWRVTKRFGKAPRAQLVDLAGKRIVARGAEADEALAKMLEDCSAGLGALGLVWVGQKESLFAPRPDFDPARNKPADRGERSALTTAIETEIGSMSGAGLADAVRARVEAQLDDLVTMRGAKKGGRFSVALERRERLQQELAVERSALEGVATAQKELDVLQARFGEVGNPQQIAVLEEQARAAAAAVEDIEKKRLRVQQAEEAVSNCRKEQETSRAALARFQTDLDRLGELSAGSVEEEARLAELSQAARAAQDDYDRARAHGERLRDEERRLQVLKSRFEICLKLEERSRALKEADRLEREIAIESERMRSDPVTGERIDRLQHLQHQLALAEERISAESPSVRIAYEPGNEKQIVLGGEVLADGAVVHAREPMVLEIAGVGRIEIAPGIGEGREELLERSAKLANERDALLDEVGANDLAGAQVLFAERQKRDRGLSSAISELRGLAPDGIVSLRSEVGDLENQLGRLAQCGVAEQDGPEDEDVAQRLQDVVAKLEAARRSYPDCAAARDAAASELAAAKVAVAARQQRIEELERILGAEEARAEMRAELEARAIAADRELGEALHKAAALKEVLPNEQSVATLRARAESAGRTLEEARHESVRLRERMSALAARVEMAGDNGVGRRLAELEGEMERCEAEVAGVEAEIASLKLLQEALQTARRQSRDRLLAPLQERVGPYLKAVFGKARVQFAEGFAVEGLERDGNSRENIDRLSDGTQEQLGIIARLAYGRLLADSGAPLPLILDDPLVYSDGERIGQMFEALRVAAKHHQVVVLTCREHAFTPLGGTRLDVVPWRGEFEL